MGLRKWISRPMRGHHLGVEDLTTGEEGLPASMRRKWTLQTIDSAPFQIWVVIVAGIGFLTDSFDLFSLNVVTPMIGYVYWPQSMDDKSNISKIPKVPKEVATAMMCATLGATMIGQVAFGFAADILGRRKMYGLELVIVIVGTMLMIMSSSGERNSMAVGGWLIAWRAVMGLGIGADYPLSAVITSEFAPRKYRARMLAAVFFAQPIGQLLANVLSYAAVEGFKSHINVTAKDCRNDDQCIRAVDRLWRLVVGIGIVPAVIALAFRFTIPESPRFKLDILQNVQSVFEDTQDYFGGPKVDEEDGELDALPTSRDDGLSRRSSASSEIAPDEVIDSDSDDGMRNTSVPNGNSRPPSAAMPLPPTHPNYLPPLASREDIKKFFIDEGNWRYLLGTSLSWLFLDFAFYGLGMSSPDIVRYVWPDDGNKVYESLRDNSKHSLVMVSIGATIGGAAMIKVIKYASPKVIQFWGFIVLFVLLVVTGGAWKQLLQADKAGLIILYILCQIAFNLGPNVTTFIIPAEIFPTRYRCTCHGIAAASGKLGSWLAQLLIAYPFHVNGQKDTWKRENFGYVLLVMSVFMLAGAVTTYFLVPETRDHDNKSRTLEVLAGGRIVLKELNQQRRIEED
ncbi:inorganic phosphate transporter 1-4 /Pi cotransporter [Aaosphaeria arxii CBS 175.79]|uniref:Inorganic phosphate transporter 1-4 /Pi cotransporter n=1 Tax=Aaosphaeria arxii CBS 175.79 TaxID=1450172 RepID=A0A6A5XL23_9PLEO|nr:inorganic phosphate transporter 1-4 /Pi cotransporter [Aaosphaeria arxii CBS 175.79]KAF2013586.1 inorganic phosphate transporter 1-4 /Pi cotransporter [Aaosphaeria arxii CBS 175.79]